SVPAPAGAAGVSAADGGDVVVATGGVVVAWPALSSSLPAHPADATTSTPAITDCATYRHMYRGEVLIGPPECLPMPSPRMPPVPLLNPSERLSMKPMLCVSQMLRDS